MSGIPIITPLDKLVGQRVQKLRTEKNITQEQLADVLECSVAFVSYLETGKRAWSNKWIWDVCQFFNIDAAELFGGMVVSESEKEILKAIKKSVSISSEIEDAKTKS